MARFLIAAFIGIVILLWGPKYSSAEYGDIILNKTAKSMRDSEVDDVLFPHWFHRIRFKCKVCHEEIFVLKAGANDINMDKIMEGEQCGVCHDGTIAWEPLECERCHSQEPGWQPGVVQDSKRLKK